MTVVARCGRFTIVSTAGFVMQVAVVGALTTIGGVGAPAATAAGVTAAVLHNFIWHLRWTWGDRPGARPLTALARFTATNGAVSLAGNVALVSLLVERTPVGPLAANVLAVALCGVLNFWSADRLAFRS